MNLQAGVQRAEVKKANEALKNKKTMYNKPVNDFKFTGKMK